MLASNKMIALGTLPPIPDYMSATAIAPNRHSIWKVFGLESVQLKHSVAAGITFLYWWAFDVSERAENAAIPFIWLQQRIARFAFVVILTSICWHDLLFTVAAVWASQGRF